MKETSVELRGRHSTRMLPTVLALLLIASGLMVLPASPAVAEVVHSPMPVEVTATVTPIATGPGSQNDPHISGTLMSYSDAGDNSLSVRGIRYRDLVTGADAAIPTEGQFDSASDVFGTRVVFRRIYTDGSTSAQQILAFDTADPAAGTTLLGADAEARNTRPSIGGSTVVWMQHTGVSSAVSEIVAHTLGGATTWLTNSGASSQEPDVSPDGDVATWTTCDASGACDVFVARKDADGTWGGATRLTDDGSEESSSATNGAVVAYTSDAAGDHDIWWENLDGTDEHRLAVVGDDYGAAVSGTLIVFVHQTLHDTDLFAYDMATDVLYQLTNTPTVREMLPDVAVDGNGVARVVWAQADGIEFGHNDVYAMSFQVSGVDTHDICPQFDQTRSHRVRSTVPIRIQVCDGTGHNLSSPNVALTATGLMKLDGSASSVLAADAGNANPDGNFRYDDSSAQYIFNLSTKDLSAGTWQLDFTATGDPTTHHVTFDLR